MAVSNALGRPRRGAWLVVAALIAAAVFAEAVFAGAMLSGVGWARPAHTLTALVVVVTTLGSGLLALTTLRGAPQGRRLAALLLALAAGLVLQGALGGLTAKGANLLWAHVPLGVALVGLAMQAMAAARRLGGG